MDSEDYRKKIEEEILDIIEDKLIKREMDAPRARAIARMVLDHLHPHMELEEIYKQVETFDDYFTELAKIAVEVEVEHERKLKAHVAAQVENLIREKKFNEASQILKQTLTKNVVTNN